MNCKSAWYTNNEIYLNAGEAKIYRRSFTHLLTISSIFFSEKCRWVNLRTYCCTVSSLLFFVWLGDFANISSVIFPILKYSNHKNCLDTNVWAYYKETYHVTWKQLSVSLETTVVPRSSYENTNERYWALDCRQTRWRPEGKWQVSVFLEDFQVP